MSRFSAPVSSKASKALLGRRLLPGPPSALFVSGRAEALPGAIWCSVSLLLLRYARGATATRGPSAGQTAAATIPRPGGPRVGAAMTMLLLLLLAQLVSEQISCGKERRSAGLPPIGGPPRAPHPNPAPSADRPTHPAG